VKANRVGTCHKCGGNGPVADLPTGAALCAACMPQQRLVVHGEDVIELRNATGLPTRKCVFALEEAGGDFEKAKAALIREALDRQPRAGDVIF
jgi:hypothetical protein